MEGVGPGALAREGQRQSGHGDSLVWMSDMDWNLFLLFNGEWGVFDAGDFDYRNGESVMCPGFWDTWEFYTNPGVSGSINYDGFRLTREMDLLLEKNGTLYNSIPIDCRTPPKDLFVKRNTIMSPLGLSDSPYPSLPVALHFAPDHSTIHLDSGVYKVDYDTQRQKHSITKNVTIKPYKGATVTIKPWDYDEKSPHWAPFYASNVKHH